jgi:uncharacterized membrane protein
MSHVVVVTFDNRDEAGNVREALRRLEKDGLLQLNDAAVVVKNMDGKTDVQNQAGSGSKTGAVVGGVLGLFLFGIFAPVVGAAVGAGSGAVIGSKVVPGVDQTFVREVSEALRPGTSALFLEIRAANPDAAINALKPYKGTVYHTNLSPKVEAEICSALQDRTVS